MFKRVVLGGVLLVVLAVVLIAVWQPRALQQQLVTFVAAKVAETTPYQLQIESVSGNFFRRFTLVGVHLRAKSATTDLLSAENLRLGLRWNALLHHRIDVQEIIFEKPVIHLTMGKNRQLILPASSAARHAKASAPPLFFVEHFEIHQGCLIFHNESLSPPTTLVLKPIALSSSLTPDIFSITQLLVGIGSGEAEGKGKISTQKPWTADLQLRTHNFPIHELLRSQVKLPEPVRLTHTGRWVIDGKGQKWQLKTTGTIDGSDLKIDATLDTLGPYEMSIHLGSLEMARVWAVAEAERFGHASIDLKVAAETFTSRLINLEGSAQLDPPAKTGILAPRLLAQASLIRGRGVVFASASAQGLQFNTTTQIDLTALTLQDSFEGSLTNFRGVSPWIPSFKEATGSLNARGAVQGPFQSLKASVTAQGNNLQFQGRTLETMSLIAQGGIGNRNEFEANVGLKNLMLHAGAPSPWDVTSAEVKVSGALPALHPQATIHFRNDAVFTYVGVFQQLGEGWRLNWSTLSLAPTHEPAWTSTHAGTLTARRSGTFDLEGLSLSNGQGTFELPTAQIHRQNMAMQLHVKDLALLPLSHLVFPGKKYGGVLNADVFLTGAERSPQGSVSLHVTRGNYNGLLFNSLDVKAQCAPPWINISTFVVQLEGNGNDLQGEGSVPMHLLDPTQPNLPIRLTLSAPHLDPQAFAAAIPAITVEKGGNASLQLNVNGLYPDVSVEGTLSARLPKLKVKPIGLDLHQVVAEVRAHGKTLEIRQFNAKTKKGDITIAGTSTLPELNFTIQGKNVPLFIPKQLDARIDLAILLDGDLEGPDVAGDLMIKDATYILPKKTKKDKEKEAAEAAAKEQEEKSQLSTGQANSSLWEGTTLNVHAQWPRNVWYRDGLSKIETSGDVRVRKDEGTTTPFLSGTISVVRGTYDAFGRDFVLNSGNLIFTGPPEINPLLNIEAQYSSGGTVVYLDITGSAKQPVLNLKSNPPLSEQDIISVLVLGQPLNQVGPGQTAETSKSQQAQALAGSVVSGYLTKELRESGMDFVGLDVVRVEPTASGNRLTVGRYIGEKLFVSYGQPLQTGAARVFDADYYLNKFWTVLGETGTLDSHMDLQFRYPINQPADVPTPAHLPVRPPKATLSTHE